MKWKQTESGFRCQVNLCLPLLTIFTNTETETSHSLLRFIFNSASDSLFSLVVKMDPDVSNRKEFRLDCSASGHPESRRDSSDCGGGGEGARYKLMSPAKLPISRSTCITIPPGLSPTSFLESPVLLSNIKVNKRLRLLILCETIRCYSDGILRS